MQEESFLLKPHFGRTCSSCRVFAIFTARRQCLRVGK
ncbi:MAG: hypothetical protein ACJAWV_002784, partial [Flammeovirgaceae bacterium]